MADSDVVQGKYTPSYKIQVFCQTVNFSVYCRRRWMQLVCKCCLLAICRLLLSDGCLRA